MKISQTYPGVHPQVSEKFVSDCFYLHAAQGMVNQPSEVRIRVESLENFEVLRKKYTYNFKFHWNQG